MIQGHNLRIDRGACRREREKYHPGMDFTIVTPSFQQLERLECCIASVADQQGVSVEHIVQDGGTEGFENFTKQMERKWPNRQGYRRFMVSEKDGGMYDAINRGFQKATGAIYAYLNCDEQYLSGTLHKVANAFRCDPHVDLLFGDALVVDEKGKARCWRKVLVPLVGHTWTCHFSAFTAAMFFRRRVVDAGISFDASYRAAADAAWYLKVRRRGIKAGRLGFIAAAFSETGNNLGMSEQAEKERVRLNSTAPLWMRAARPGWLAIHRARRFLGGAYRTGNFSYAIFQPSHHTRQAESVKHLRSTWPGRCWGF